MSGVCLPEKGILGFCYLSALGLDFRPCHLKGEGDNLNTGARQSYRSLTRTLSHPNITTESRVQIPQWVWESNLKGDRWKDWETVMSPADTSGVLWLSRVPETPQEESYGRGQWDSDTRWDTEESLFIWISVYTYLGIIHFLGLC